MAGHIYKQVHGAIQIRRQLERPRHSAIAVGAGLHFVYCFVLLVPQTHDYAAVCQHALAIHHVRFVINSLSRTVELSVQYHFRHRPITILVVEIDLVRFRVVVIPFVFLPSGIRPIVWSRHLHRNRMVGRFLHGQRHKKVIVIIQPYRDSSLPVGAVMPVEKILLLSHAQSPQRLARAVVREGVVCLFVADHLADLNVGDGDFVG